MAKKKKAKKPGFFTKKKTVKKAKVTKKDLSQVMKTAAKHRKKGKSQSRALELAWAGVPARKRKKTKKTRRR